jgi:hypothetical protein
LLVALPVLALLLPAGLLAPLKPLLLGVLVKCLSLLLGVLVKCLFLVPHRLNSPQRRQRRWLPKVGVKLLLPLCRSLRRHPRRLGSVLIQRHHMLVQQRSAGLRALIIPCFGMKTIHNGLMSKSAQSAPGLPRFGLKERSRRLMKSLA